MQPSFGLSHSRQYISMPRHQNHITASITASCPRTLCPHPSVFASHFMDKFHQPVPITDETVNADAPQHLRPPFSSIPYYTHQYSSKVSNFLKHNPADQPAYLLFANLSTRTCSALLFERVSVYFKFWDYMTFVVEPGSARLDELCKKIVSSKCLVV